MQLRTVSSTPVVQLATLAVDLATLAENNIFTGVTHLAAVGQLYARAPRAYRVAMVAGASLKVAEHAGGGIAADAAIGMSGTMHDTTARTFAARPYSGFAYGNTVTRVFHQACDEIGGEPWVIPQFFFHHVEPLKLLVPQPGGGDPP